ncbi:MAG: hypothetical protein OES09_12195 [Gammaproteobacteria bacterium]|nr:hypothetical protein [Gammaproteobacteria bacterium]
MNVTSVVSRMGFGLTMAGVLLLITIARADQWRPLLEDGLHDPQVPAVELLQNPTAAFSKLPRDTAGNKVDWIRALRDGYIKPRSGLLKDKDVEILDQDVLMNRNGSIPLVLFPHKPHTMWLDCENCHEKIFKSKAGATGVTMTKILEGEFCGVCHGAVAFPLTECNRCHSVPFNSPLVSGSAPVAR